MEAIRKIIDSEAIAGAVALPGSLRHKKVEILVFPVSEDSRNVHEKRSVFGALKKYANPSLIEQESAAWATAAASEYETR
ncbi:MAG: hypothetical protein LBS91_09040 [Clostridiales Family XIII bacterium]|jgi:hypothetical protein|nr:hypothetical protein [Clostridiales Family XIII bacterium]